MRTFRDARAMATSLRQSLRERDIELPHSQALEIVAAQFGCRDWNVLAARIAGDEETAPPAPGVSFQPAIPVLRIFSEANAREFYLDYLGFQLDWEHRFEPSMPLYAQVSRTGLILHLSEHHGDGTPGSAVFIWMREIEAFHAELSGRSYPHLRPGIEPLPWGRELRLTDPFGNHLRFCQATDE